jgi:predicted DNA-binding protein with PD1-like motif
VAKIYSLKTGAKIPEAVIEIARKEKVRTAKVEAIGGVDHLELAYFNHRTKKYENHNYDEFLEVTGLLGNITLKDGKPFLHAHGTFGRKDMSVVGGHVISADVRPILEVILTPTKNLAMRRFDEESGLNVIYSTEKAAKVSK